MKETDVLVHLVSCISKSLIIIIINIIMAVYLHLNARYKIKITHGARRKSVTSPVSKFTITSYNKQKKIN